jgi:tripeptide aminopeptidase
MESALKIASRVIERLPRAAGSPETTEEREGFLHPTDMQGTIEEARISFIVRAFDEQGLADREALLEATVAEVMREFPGSSCDLKIEPQYRNMKKVLDQHPQVTANALEAIRRAGLQPRQASIRGGTDGSRLSFMGLPCPNIFAGEHAFHSKTEWVSVQDMEKAVDTIVHLAMIWEERA